MRAARCTAACSRRSPTSRSATGSRLRRNPPTSMVTANLSVDFAGSAQIGDWVETSLDIQKVGSRMAFANVYFSVGGERIARASGVFLVLAKASR